MNRWQSICLIAAVAVVGTVCYVSSVNRGSLTEGGGQGPPGGSACSQSLESTERIEDIGKVPQDLRSFAALINESMNIDEPSQLLQRFRQRYFSPWTATALIFNVNLVTEQVNMLASRTWYGENRHLVDQERIRGLLALADLGRCPSMNQLGVMIKPAFIRVLPTFRPFYEAPDDFPFDHLQFAESKPNEPVRILHASKDGAWLYIETSYANGWVEPDAVRFVDPSVQKRMLHSAQVVVVRDFAEMRTEQGEVLPQPKIGTLYPLVEEKAGYWLVEAAVAGGDQYAALKTARIAKGDGRRHPLPFTPEAVTRVGNEILKTAYGWGELYRNRDCSATTRDFLLAFGIWLPRNSQLQITSGPLVSLAHLSSTDKEKLIGEQGVPFRTILHHKGHIMLYIGLHDGKPIILHTVWALRYQPEGCPEKKRIIGRTVLTTLAAGKELPLSKGTTLDRLDGMLVLPARDGEQGEK